MEQPLMEQPLMEQAVLLLEQAVLLLEQAVMNLLPPLHLRLEEVADGRLFSGRRWW
jgi:hypothetical protein